MLVFEGLYVLEVYGLESLYVIDYGSQGYYYFDGQIIVSVVDIMLLDFNLMQFVVELYFLSVIEIVMELVVVIDDCGGVVFYLFSCIYGDVGCENSEWQIEIVFMVSGLLLFSEYCFMVSVWDFVGNVIEVFVEMCIIIQDMLFEIIVF